MIPGFTYHIYNHANGFENLFREPGNYTFFIEKLQQYLLPVCKLFAYSLLPSHFHLLGKIHNRDLLLENLFNGIGSKNRKAICDLLVSRKISRKFSDLFNCYAQSYNKYFSRRGSLFAPNFKRREVLNDHSFRRCTHFIHANPVHQGFSTRMENWKYSSYKSYLLSETTFLDTKYVLKKFGGLNNFIYLHKHPVELFSDDFKLFSAQ